MGVLVNCFLNFADQLFRFFNKVLVSQLGQIKQL